MTKNRKHKTNKQSPVWRKLDMLILYMHTQSNMLDPAFLKATESTFYPIGKPPKQREDRMETPADRALRLARIINTQDEYIRTYTALMIAYNRHHKADKALNFGRLAWELTPDTDETKEDRGLIAYEMAVAHRIQRDLEQTKVWLLRASQLLVMTDNTKQYAKIAHETSVAHYLTKEYEQSEQWSLIAINEADELGISTFKALYRIQMMMTLYKLDKLDNALNYSIQASTIFKELKDSRNLVICLSYALEIYVQHKHDQTKPTIDTLIDELQAIDDQEFREKYLKRIRELQQEVEEWVSESTNTQSLKKN